MQVNQIKSLLGKIVYYDDSQINFSGTSLTEYIFSGCVLRKDSKGKIRYQAELRHPKIKETIIVPLEKVKVDSWGIY